MAKRRKPLLIVDDRYQPDEAWIPVTQLPDKDYYGWSKRMIVCQFAPGDRHPTLMTASYDFSRQRWFKPMGEVKNVTHWQPLPDYPKEYRT